MANSFEYEFELSQLAANAQMEQASRRPLRGDNFGDGISNLSTINSSKKFKEKLEKYEKEILERAERNEAVWGVFQFEEEK